MKKGQRRNFLKKMGISLAALSFTFRDFAEFFSSNKKENTFRESARSSFRSNFSGTNDRTWIGEDYWAIPMEDWRVNKGRIEFSGRHHSARVNILTQVIEPGFGDFSVKADMGMLPEVEVAGNGSAGFSLGIKDELDPDVKAACYYGKGIRVGLSTEGFLFVGGKRVLLPEAFDYSQFSLEADVRHDSKVDSLTLKVQDNKGKGAEICYCLDSDINGLVALVNNFDKSDRKPFWFNHIVLKGSKLKTKAENSFGPILWAMHTLSRTTLKISAQMPPIGANDHQFVELYFNKWNDWEMAGREKIDIAARVATFNLMDWNPEVEVEYKLSYENQGKEYIYEGTIRKEPIGKPLKVGGLTCQYGSGYPYSPLVSNLEKHNPDLLYFSGDQLYEGNGGYPIKRSPEDMAILSYLGKWYMFGWAFGNVMRDRPAICTPDDHDVFQGNLWGAGGDMIPPEIWKKKRGTVGGYVQTPKMVNVVAKTQCGHLPDPFDFRPLSSGIDVWYTELIYGKVSFAIISDRMFKSGPERLDFETEGRSDHIKQLVGKGVLDSPELKLLGERQLEFMQSWINEWAGANMKVLLSQTVFANVATHHGRKYLFLYGDLDSGGWPKSAGDRAVEIMRQGFAFHINGDQHLPFIVQYGQNGYQNAGWSFCTPAISTGYPRWFLPDDIGIPVNGRPGHNLPNTGQYEDVFGNKNYVYAVGNPAENYKDSNRYEQAQKKSSGFGMITFDTDERTILMESFRFLADKDNPSEGDQFPGWPLSISQFDNEGRDPKAFLPELRINKPDQVVKVINEKDNAMVNVLRINGNIYQPAVYQPGTYTIQVGEGKDVKAYKGVHAIPKEANEVIIVNF